MLVGHEIISKPASHPFSGHTPSSMVWAGSWRITHEIGDASELFVFGHGRLPLVLNELRELNCHGNSGRNRSSGKSLSIAVANGTAEK
jgi:hypothetical protein